MLHSGRLCDSWVERTVECKITEIIVKWGYPVWKKQSCR